MDTIQNKVADSGLITIDPAEFYTSGKRMIFDLKPLLFEELLLREKDLRDFIKVHDWTQYSDALVAVYCSSDAIIPVWAYMLIASAMQPYAKMIHFGTPDALEEQLFDNALKNFDVTAYNGKRIVVKGCGDIPVPVSVYMRLTTLLQPVVKSILYGEPCSTVPVYKLKG